MAGATSFASDLSRAAYHWGVVVQHKPGVAQLYRRTAESPDERCSAMQQNSLNSVFRFDQTPSTRADRLRKEALGTPHGVRRDELLRRAREIEGLPSLQESLVSVDLQLFK